MPKIDRRDFLKVMGLGAAATAAPILSSKAFSGTKMPKGFYDLPMKGNVRILHITDVHGQLKPVHFRRALFPRRGGPPGFSAPAIGADPQYTGHCALP